MINVLFVIAQKTLNIFCRRSLFNFVQTLNKVNFEHLQSKEKIIIFSANDKLIYYVDNVYIISMSCPDLSFLFLGPSEYVKMMVNRVAY